MIRNLIGTGQIARETDVLIIGAGTAGLVMASALRDRGIKVVCLESGDEHQDEETHPLNTVEHVRTTYAGAAHGRFRCLGGTSTRWGGALIPLAAADFDTSVWPIGMPELSVHVKKVEELFGLPSGTYEASEVFGPGADHVARLAKWPPFRRRNVATLLGAVAKASKGVEVWLNATASWFSIANGRLVETTALAPDGSQISVRAKNVVFASGAIESTRLLLLLDRQNGGLIGRNTRWLGSGFFDHLSAPVAELAVRDRSALNRLVGFQFGPNGTMRNMRFELSVSTTLRASLASCFAHVFFESGTSRAFVELRHLFRVLQRGRLPGFAQIARLAMQSPWLAKAVYWRYVERRLLYPADASIQLHMVIDQESVIENRITLSEKLRDPYGQPLARIDWAVTEGDRVNMLAATDAMLASWNRSVLASMASPARRSDKDIWSSMENGGGIYHPGGSTRMANRPDEGVVDAHLRVFQIPNLRIVATSVMPTGGSANPTMTLLLMAIRCVDDLAGER